MTYDHWKTTEPDDGAEPPDEKPVFTEADMAAAVEAEREAIEKLIAEAEKGWPGSGKIVSRMLAAIAARKKRIRQT